MKETLGKTIVSSGQGRGSDPKMAGKKDGDKTQRSADGARRLRAVQDGFRAIASEMKRVTWPTRDEWLSATAVVIALVVVMALWTAGVGALVERLLKLGT